MSNIENLTKQRSEKLSEILYKAFKYDDEQQKIKLQKKNESMESILKKNDWKSMTFEKSYTHSDIYEVITLNGEHKEINAYYCDDCGYVIGTLNCQKFVKGGCLSLRGGTNYKCNCGKIIKENVSIVG